VRLTRSSLFERDRLAGCALSIRAANFSADIEQSEYVTLGAFFFGQRLSDNPEKSDGTAESMCYRNEFSRRAVRDFRFHIHWFSLQSGASFTRFEQHEQQNVDKAVGVFAPNVAFAVQEAVGIDGDMEAAVAIGGGRARGAMLGQIDNVVRSTDISGALVRASGTAAC